MRLAVVGHSLIHVRQQSFYRVLASLGHEVYLVCPRFWHGQTSIPAVEHCVNGVFAILPCHGLSDAPDYTSYNFTLMGLADTIAEVHPDIVYANAEPGSNLLDQCGVVCESASIPLAIFTWENMFLKGKIPENAALVVCGNDDAERLVQSARSGIQTAILPQVGVDTDHFQARPEVKRTVDVAYIGRNAAEKGVSQLMLAWPSALVLPWKDYQELPWWYSCARCVVCFSQDTPLWKEQAMPYVLAEAMSCGCAVVASNAGSIRFWARRFAGDNPGVWIVNQYSLESLRGAIDRVLNREGLAQVMAELGRRWVVESLGSRVIAKRLVEALEGVA